MYRRVSRRQAVPSCKGQGGVLEQEKSPGLPLRSPGNPESFLVATDEKLRDRLADDAGIERLKRRGDRRGLYSRQDAGTLAVPSGPNGRTRPQLTPREVRCGIKSGCGHGGLLTNPTVLSNSLDVPACHRNARW